MYRVIKYFTDIHDNDHPYDVGDKFPRDGVKVTESRIVELAGSDNRQKVPLIEEVEEEKPETAEKKTRKAAKKKPEGEAAGK